MKCSRIQDKLLLFQASELSAAESEQIRQHLRKCVCCNAVASEIRELERVAGYAVATTVTAPLNLNSRVMCAIRADMPPSIWRRPVTIPRFSRPVYVALAIFLLTSGFALGMWTANNPTFESFQPLPPPAPCGHDGIIPGKSLGPGDNTPHVVKPADPHPKDCKCLATPACGKGSKGKSGGKATRG